MRKSGVRCRATQSRCQSKIRQYRLAFPCRRIEHFNSRSKSDRTEAVGHSDGSKSLPIRRPGNWAEMIPAPVNDLTGGVFVSIN